MAKIMVAKATRVFAANKANLLPHMQMLPMVVLSSAIIAANRTILLHSVLIPKCLKTQELAKQPPLNPLRGAIPLQMK
jgi:uncharacterized membrane protein YGL010W